MRAALGALLISAGLLSGCGAMHGGMDHGAGGAHEKCRCMEGHSAGGEAQHCKMCSDGATEAPADDAGSHESHTGSPEAAAPQGH